MGHNLPFCFRQKRLRVAWTEMTEGHIEVDYRLQSPEGALAGRVEALLLEQTVELPRSALRTSFVRDRLVGRVLATESVGPGDFRVTLAQPELATGDDPAQLLNVLFGNCSLQPDVQLEDVRLSPRITRALGGPRFGSAGIRRLVGAEGRALTASVLKPIGLTNPESAELCRNLSLGGLDIVKDDHGHADHSFGPFGERVRLCLKATDEAAQKTGRRTLYVPNLTGSPATVLLQARLAREAGVGAVMVSPMLIGLPFLVDLASELGMPILAHPAFGGAQRISPLALLGRLFPAFGSDAVIFPSYGGRFSYSRAECGSLAGALTAPAAGSPSCFPVPAGGMKVESLAEALGFYGKESILLIGGSLLDAPDADSLVDRARQFVEAVARHPYTR